MLRNSLPKRHRVIAHVDSLSCGGHCRDPSGGQPSRNGDLPMRDQLLPRESGDLRDHLIVDRDRGTVTQAQQLQRPQVYPSHPRCRREPVEFVSRNSSRQVWSRAGRTTYCFRGGVAPPISTTSRLRERWSTN
jgi:hypothetical protein